MASAPQQAEPAEHDGAPNEAGLLKRLVLASLKRARDTFAIDFSHRPLPDEDSQGIKLACKIRDEYAALKYMAPAPTAPGEAGPDKKESQSALGKLIDNVAGKVNERRPGGAAGGAGAIVLHAGLGGGAAGPASGAAGTLSVTGGPPKYTPSAVVMKRLASKWPKPEWHAPWKLYRVISGHLGWVRSIAFDPSNEWFATGSGDRTIKIWDTASGTLKLTLTGHIENVMGLAVSPRSPYLFSCGLDKMVKCWDLEYNKVIRNYHGHLSGVYALALHPTLDVLLTGGRDSTCRVWDIRTKAQAFCLSGHENTVCSIITQGLDPQVITGAHDSTIRCWDLAAGKTMSTLTHHKKSVRGLAKHPTERTFMSASPDNIKKWQLPSPGGKPEVDFLFNVLDNQRTIVNCLAVNADGVVASGGDNGSLWFWDWKSGNNFQKTESLVQPGSLESEGGIYAASFDQTGARLVTCEADKTIKMWKEDDRATPETHPVVFKPPKENKRF